VLCLVIVPQLVRSEDEVATMRGNFANRADYEYLIEEDAIVIGPDGVIARLVTGCLDEKLIKDTAKYFRTVHHVGSNRGSIAGRDSMMYRERKDGGLGFTKAIPKSIVKKMQERNEFTDFLGWMDASEHGDRFPTCRQTAWSVDSPIVLDAARPFVKEVSRVYEGEVPDHYRQQKEFTDRASASFRFPDSVYTTVTVNRNKRTTYHSDSGDFRGGMGNLIVLDSDGSGPLVMPKFRLALLPRPGDVLLMNVHELHGNGIFTGERLTAVLYAREHIDECEKEKGDD
jgi:hypothetical protein